MLIGGLQKLTLIDYPGKVACTLFTYGCNFRCPFCHNASLVTDEPALIPEEEFFAFLRKRQGMLDGVGITGGEPLLQKDMVPFLEKIKSLGYAVKLDTNGSFPERLKEVVSLGLVDLVAMDIKNEPAMYAATAGTEVSLDAIKESVSYLLSDAVPYEFRTTMVKGYHTEASMRGIGEWIRGAKRYFLQNFVDSGHLIGEAEGLTEEEMRQMLDVVREYIPTAELRGL